MTLDSLTPSEIVTAIAAHRQLSIREAHDLYKAFTTELRNKAAAPYIESLSDQFAAAYLNGYIAHKGMHAVDRHLIAKEAYMHADAMLTARKEKA